MLFRANRVIFDPCSYREVLSHRDAQQTDLGRYLMGSGFVPALSFQGHPTRYFLPKKSMPSVL